MIVFPTESRELLRKIVRADDACLIFKPKSCFSDEWKRETDFPEIGGVKSLVVFLFMWGLFFKIVPKRIWHKKTASLRPRISVPGFREKPKNRSNGPPNENQCPVKSSVLHGACHFCLISLKTSDLWLSLQTFSRPPREREIPPKTPILSSPRSAFLSTENTCPRSEICISYLKICKLRRFCVREI